MAPGERGHRTPSHKAQQQMGKVTQAGGAEQGDEEDAANTGLLDLARRVGGHSRRRKAETDLRSAHAPRPPTSSRAGGAAPPGGL